MMMVLDIGTKVTKNPVKLWISKKVFEKVTLISLSSG